MTKYWKIIFVDPIQSIKLVFEDLSQRLKQNDILFRSELDFDVIMAAGTCLLIMLSAAIAFRAQRIYSLYNIQFIT